MADSPLNDLTGLAKATDSKIVRTVYKDGLQGATKQSGLLLEDLSKTARMVLQPLMTVIQGSAQRIDSWVAEAVSKVPKERFAEANPKLLNATVLAMGVEDDESPLREYYIKLLSSMMDQAVQCEVHPSFPKILQELSPLDATLLQVTPHGNQVRLPEEILDFGGEITSGLIVTWDMRNSSGQDYEEYRLFVKVDRNVMLTPKTTRTSGVLSGEHIGFIEFLLPKLPRLQENMVAWHNLERLGLVHQTKYRKGQEILQDFNCNNVEGYNQLAGMHRKYGPLQTHSIRQTPLGLAFSRCCIPQYSGEVIWHAYNHSPNEQASK